MEENKEKKMEENKEKKMETNNKLREALKSCVDEMCDRCRELAAARGNPLPCLNGCEPVRKAKFALLKPPRNCEVGTADEQEERFRKFCKMDCISGDCPDDCPLCKKDYSTIHCPFTWAQMPYDEGGAAI